MLDNKFNGYGAYFYKDGCIEYGQWKNDEICGKYNV
jgi:hypothetical protein